MTTLLIKGGTAAKGAAYTGDEGELSIDTDSGRLRVHDGATAGGYPTAKASEVPAKTSDIENDAYWSQKNLTALSRLTNDSNYWKKSELTKISQLTNDSGFQTGHCSHCTYCSYCTNCS